MRVLLFTGKGGVGKTTAAAGTATLAATRGLKTLVLSTDGAHSLGDAFDAEVGAEPTEVDTGLYVQQVDAQSAFQRSWQEIQSYLVAVLHEAGVDPIEAEELTVLPGFEEVLALLALRDQVLDDRWDLVVVDCAPTAETLRLLALPEALDWYMARVFPMERRVVKTLRPVLTRMAGVPMPQDQVFVAVERLHRQLGEVRRVLTDPMTSVRLVLTPEAVVVAEARRMLTSLALFGYQVDAVVANRVFPCGGSTDGWLAGWSSAQAVQLGEIDVSFSPLPVYRAAYAGAEPVGVEALAAFGAALYAGVPDPFAPASGPDLMEVERDGSDFVLSLALPLADRRSLDLVRKGDELVVTLGSHRRILALPSALRRCSVEGAAFRDGRLRVRFVPDPAVWMHQP